MTYTALGNARIAPSANGGTSASVNTTGANLIWFFVTSYAGATAPTVSDSKGNTWNARTSYTAGSGDAERMQMFWCNPSSVGSGHTFTITGAGSFSTGYIQYLSGGSTSTPVDQEITGTNLASPLQAGSVTPTEDAELCVSAYIAGSAGTINESYTLLYQDETGGSGYSGGVAYKIQTTAAATNPSWTASGGGISMRAYTITFKAGTGPTVAVLAMNHYRQRA